MEVRSVATDAIVGRHLLQFYNALPSGYQRIYIRCITSLQRPKSQRMINVLVRVIATPIWVFRYRFMRCGRGGRVVVQVFPQF
jgi:hypothetical protein